MTGEVINTMVGGGEIFMGIGIAILITLLAIALFNRICPSKSHDYRRYVVDMFISSKVRKLANAEGLNLNAEEITFSDWVKKQKVKEIVNIDSKIIEEINSKIDESIEKNKTKKEK